MEQELEFVCERWGVVYRPPTARLYATTAVIDVHAGSAVAFRCNATSGGRAPTLSWWKDGKRIAAAQGAVLRVSGLQETDEGWYSCRAASSAGSARSNEVEVTVRDPPAVGAMQQRLQAETGSTATFVCPVRAEC